MTEEDKWPFKQSRYLNHPDKSSEEFRIKQERAKKQREARETKEKLNREIDPCAEEAEVAKQCLYWNYDNKEICNEATENVRRCKKFWRRVMWSRIYKGERPYIPDSADRDKVFEEYKHYL